MSIDFANLKLSVTSAMGIEAVTKRELLALGIGNAPAENGRLSFSGSLTDVARCNLWLRTADRVYIVLKEFEADDFNTLFDGIFSIEWEAFLGQHSVVNVAAKSQDSALFALSTIQSITKKAICVRLMKAYKIMQLPEDGAPFKIIISILQNRVAVLLDTSGMPLHKRGYRDLVGEAPLKETLASALILLSVWRADRALIDPFAGSGTIPIEAARIALNIAPGRDRSFAYEQWEMFPKQIIEDTRQEVLDTQTLDKKIRISGFDIDKEAVKLSLHHAERAGVKEHIHLQTGDMREVKTHYRYGVVVTNPPYGERLLNEHEAFLLYGDFGKWYRTLEDWSLYAITSLDGFEHAFGAQATKTRKLYNGKLKCRFYQYLGARPPRSEEDCVDNKSGTPPLAEAELAGEE